MNLGTAYVVVKTDRKGLPGELKLAKKEVEGAVFSMKQTIKEVNWKSVGIGLAAVSGAAALAFNKVLDVAVQVDAMHKSMAAATGSTAAAESAFKFLRKESERLGLVFEGQIRGFKSLAAASKGTALEGDAIRKIYIGIATAATSLQMSQDEVSGAINAVSQMISKGTVQAEELRGQLGERLPGAFQIAARAMGATTQELGKMLEQGQVIAEDFLPKFADELMKTFKESAEAGAKSAGAEVNRLKNTFFDLKQEVAIGVIPALTTFLKTINFILATKTGKLPLLTKIEDVKAEVKRLEDRIKKYGETTINIQKGIGKKLSEEKRKLSGLKAEWKATLVTAKHGLDQTFVGMSDVIKATNAQTKAIKIQGVSQKTLDKLKDAARKKDEKRMAEALADIKKQVEAKEKADADMLESLRQMAKDELVVWDALNTHVLTSLDKRTAVAEAAYSDMAWGAMTMGVAFADVMNEGTALTEEELRERTLKHGSFVDGVKLGYDDLMRHQVTWAQAGVSLINDFAYAGSTAMSQSLFNVMKGEMDDFESIWQGFLDSLLRAVTDVAAQMAVKFAIKSMILPGISAAIPLLPAIGSIPVVGPIITGITDFIGGLFHQGGMITANQGGMATAHNGLMVGAANIPRAHAGMNLRRDEVPIIAQTGEAILSRRAVSSIGGPPAVNALNRGNMNGGGNAGGSSGGLIINSPLVHIEGNLIADESTFNEFVETIDVRLHELAQLEA